MPDSKRRQRRLLLKNNMAALVGAKWVNFSWADEHDDLSESLGPGGSQGDNGSCRDITLGPWRRRRRRRWSIHGRRSFTYKSARNVVKNFKIGTF